MIPTSFNELLMSSIGIGRKVTEKHHPIIGMRMRPAQYTCLSIIYSIDLPLPRIILRWIFRITHCIVGITKGIGCLSGIDNLIVSGARRGRRKAKVLKMAGLFQVSEGVGTNGQGNCCVIITVCELLNNIATVKGGVDCG